MSYGEIARSNGLRFEEIIVEYYNDEKNKLSLLNKIKEQFGFDIENIKNGRLYRHDQNKVDSIHSKKTTRKSDIYFKCDDIQFGISVKMSNKGTQLQIISLEILKLYFEYHNITIEKDIEDSLKLFLGIETEKRIWIHQLTKLQQERIVSFLTTNKRLILKLIYCDGLCRNNNDKASLFIFNDSYYSKTGEIKPVILTYTDILQKLIGDILITKTGNLQLCNQIGLQRKGSGKSSSAKCLQFKDRGFKNDFKSKIINKINMSLKGLSLFSSCGIGETYMKPYVDIVVANELLHNRAKLYTHFYPDTTMIQGDISNADIYNNILQESIRKSVDFIYATPPCQSFSKAGKQAENDHRDILFLHIINMTKALKPKYVLIENVPEFLKLFCNINNQNQKVIDVFTNELGNEYNIDSQIMNASDYEIPQSRKRAIILLSRKSEKEWKFPKKINRQITVKDAIGHLPSLESSQKSEYHKFHYAKDHNDRHILWMKNTPTGKSAFDNPIHFPSKDGRKIFGYKTTYKRISWDKPAPTITMANGSISSQNNVHPGRLLENGSYSDARVLTIYELMILTGLPSNWNIPEWCTDKIIREVIGECVPPNIILSLIKNINDGSNLQPQVEVAIEAEIEPKIEVEIEPKIEVEIEHKVEVEIEPKIEVEIEHNIEPKAEIEHKVEVDIKHKVEVDIKHNIEPKAEIKPTESINLKTLSNVQLKKICKEKKIKGYSKLNKENLIRLINSKIE
jgi:DNA (cytosine-5)-methyltransferase 1